MNHPAPRICDVRFAFEDFNYRTPIKFGGVACDRATILNVEIDLELAAKKATGRGSMPLGNIWSFPSKTLPYDTTLMAMKTLAAAVSRIYAECKETGHPIDVTMTLEHAIFDAASRLPIAEPMPRLAALVTASPFDAALHDGFGHIHGLNCYRTYGPEFMNHDLGHWLGAEFNGLPLDRFILHDPQPTMPLYHLVGALDPLDEKDIDKRVGDGLPETLGEWIHQDGLTHLKIKLNGDNLAWDVERVLGVERVAAAAQAQRGVKSWSYSLDFNEKCPDVAYLLDCLRQIQDRQPAAFDRIQYIEQPTARDLKANKHNVMHEASKIKPVVIDESLLDLESLLLAREMGYTGAALKACKGQSQSLLMAAAAQKYGMFLCVQDLTCPGASLIHSAGLAAHIPGVAAIESNARQYCPAANAPWMASHPQIFRITNGTMATGSLTGVGLSLSTGIPGERVGAG